MQQITEEYFKTLPLVAEGWSKEIRYMGNGLVAMKLRPTVYSYTHNRAGDIKGTEKLRIQASEHLVKIVEQAGIKHAYKEIQPSFIVSDLVLPESTGKLTQNFMPDDLSDAQISLLARATPIEVVVKRVHTGTPKHRYYGMAGTVVRPNHSQAGATIQVDQPYPEVVVRFDWRNPLEDENGKRLQDEVLPEVMADWYIDTKTATNTARSAFLALESSLAKASLNLWDICFFISQDGSTIFSEVSPDCLRVRSGNESLDKDVWRKGGSSGDVVDKWQAFVNIAKTL